MWVRGYFVYTCVRQGSTTMFYQESKRHETWSWGRQAGHGLRQTWQYMHKVGCIPARAYVLSLSLPLVSRHPRRFKIGTGAVNISAPYTAVFFSTSFKLHLASGWYRRYYILHTPEEKPKPTERWRSLVGGGTSRKGSTDPERCAISRNSSSWAGSSVR